MNQADLPIADRFPDARNIPTDVTKQCQAVMTRLLAIFDAVCRKYDLFYAMIGGTLIGAKQPRVVVQVDALPRTDATGQIRRRRLRDHIVAERAAE